MLGFQVSNLALFLALSAKQVQKKTPLAGWCTYYYSASKQYTHVAFVIGTIVIANALCTLNLT